MSDTFTETEITENEVSEPKQVEVWNAMMVGPVRWWKPWYKFCVVDCPQYLVENALEKYDIRPVVIQELSSEEFVPYVLLSIRIKKKHLSAFLEAMVELQKTMLICGYKDYEEFCRNLVKAIRGDEEDDPDE